MQDFSKDWLPIYDVPRTHGISSRHFIDLPCFLTVLLLAVIHRVTKEQCPFVFIPPVRIREGYALSCGTR